jgi:hypothetical protein
MGNDDNVDIDYVIVIKRKEDIIHTIQKDILDGEILDDIISSLERSIAHGIAAKQWVSLPYIGNIRLNREFISALNNRSKFNTAKAVMNKNQYLVFRKQVIKEEKLRIVREKNIEWLIRRAKEKYKKLHKELVKRYGESYANMYCYFRSLVSIIEEPTDGESTN